MVQLAVIPRLTIVAVDGAGAQTRDYLDLLRACGGCIGTHHRRLLFTSDRTARSGVDGIDIEHVQPMDYLQYSQFMVQRLAQHVQTEHCLTVQLDGFPLNPERWTSAFLAVDYVGAPWRPIPWLRPLPDGFNVGNGGFSLRSRRFLEESAALSWDDDWADQRVARRWWGNEDYFLCVLRRRALESKGVRFADTSLARRFSIQAGDRMGLRHTLSTVFGFHGRNLMRSAHRYLRRRRRSYPHLERSLPARRYFPFQKV